MFECPRCEKLVPEEDRAIAAKVCMSCQDDIDALEALTPDPETDGFLVPTGSLGGKIRVILGGEVVGVYVEEEDARKALREAMDADQFWPAAWKVDDHGGHLLITELNA